MVTSEPIASRSWLTGTARADDAVMSDRWATRGRTIWAGSFVLLLAVLVARNTFLFTTRMYDGGDTGADSLLVQQALRFDLLHGVYSRVGFYHPGPAYLYVLAAGQWLFHDVLHAVPSAWNGQLLAGFALVSALVATAVAVIHSWTRSLAATMAALAGLLAFAACVPEVLSSGWFPYLYVPTYLLFLVAATSVAAGRTEHLWAFTLAGLLLINGHVAFFLFVPVTAVVVAAALLWPRRRRPLAAIGSFVRRRRRHWLPALAVAVPLAGPTLLDLALHWPGQFSAYLHYTTTSTASGRNAGDVVRYVLQYWWPTRPGVLVPLVPVALMSLIVLGAERWSPPETRRFVHTAVWINILTTALLVAYAAHGVDNLGAKYLEYFAWSVPMLTFALFGVVAVGVLRDGLVARAAGAVLLVAGVVAVAVVPGTRTPTHDDYPSVGTAVGDLTRQAGGRPITLDLVDVGSWPYATALLVQAERTGVRACVIGSSWSIIMAGDICTAHDTETGYPVQLRQPSYTPIGEEHVLMSADGVTIVTFTR